MDYNFVDDLPEEYTCQMCMKLLKEPQITDCCGQHFCRACLDRWFKKQGKKQCPHCSKVNPLHIISWPLQRKIDELKVYCSNRTKGCGLIMTLEELEKHLSINNPNGCGYVNIECQNKCGESILRKDLTDHYDNNCRERQINCTYCNEAGPYSYITNVQDGGHVQECQQYVDCPRKCGTTQHLKREDLEGHKEECPLQPMQCPFHKAGCKQQLVRKDLESHIQSSTQQHLLNLMDAHKSLETAHKKLKLEHEELQKSDYKIKSTIASEVDNIQKTVQDKTLVRSLEEITTKLNEVAPFLTKTGDKISFKFPCGSLELDSPTVCIGDSFQLSFKLNFNNTISIVVVGSRMNGEGYIYNVKVEVKCEQRTKKQLPESHCQHKTHEFLICKLGVAIQETMLMPTDYKRGYYETCIVTLTLKRRFLFGVDQKLVDLY